MKRESRFDWRHQYDTARDELEGQLAATVNNEESLTQQHYAESADINVLAHRFGLDKGPIPQVPIDPRYYGDFTNVPDLRTALDLVNDARDRFMELPPDLRARFQNSPAQMWAFVNDPINAEACVKLGLLRAPDPEPGTEEPPKPPTP